MGKLGLRIEASESGRQPVGACRFQMMGAIARSMGAKVLSTDKAGFAGCARVVPETGSEYAFW